MRAVYNISSNHSQKITIPSYLDSCERRCQHHFTSCNYQSHCSLCLYIVINISTTLSFESLSKSLKICPLIQPISCVCAIYCSIFHCPLIQPTFSMCTSLSLYNHCMSMCWQNVPCPKHNLLAFVIKHTCPVACFL